MQDLQKSHIISTYFAPRGHARMYALGMQLVQLYLSPFDKLIGIIGEAGSGKSALIRGMFPGLELTNDDNGVYVRPLPLLEQDRGFSLFAPHTYHVDIRFETGFTQMSVLADAITEALHSGKRVIVEHFDLIYPMLEIKADLLIGVGEEVVITRPTIFGPEPKDIYDIVYRSLPYRLMAHTAEDLCEFCLPREEVERCGHDDVKHGFVLSFPDYAPDVDLKELEEKVYDLIRQDLPSPIWTKTTSPSVGRSIPAPVPGSMCPAPARSRTSTFSTTSCTISSTSAICWWAAWARTTWTSCGDWRNRPNSSAPSSPIDSTVFSGSERENGRHACRQGVWRNVPCRRGLSH